jgi:dephospho-CoA kinase
VHLFGLTGGIASGKSTVGTRLRSHGVPVIDADDLAREVLGPGTDALREVVEAFGPTVIDPSGALDRKALARVVFGDEVSRQKLNRITHPRIAARTLQRTTELTEQGEALACYEAALIVENGVADSFRPLIVCACPEDLQVARLRAREGVSRRDALARIRAQKPLTEKIATADYVVDTSGSIGDTERQADDVLRAIRARLAVDAGPYFR